MLYAICSYLIIFTSTSKLSDIAINSIEESDASNIARGGNSYTCVDGTEVTVSQGYSYLGPDWGKILFPANYIYHRLYRKK